MSAPASSPSAWVGGLTSPRVAVEALVHRSELPPALNSRRHAGARGGNTAYHRGRRRRCHPPLRNGDHLCHRRRCLEPCPDRGLVLSPVALAYLLGAAGLAWWEASRRLKSWRPFASSRRSSEPAGSDYSCLYKHLSGEIPLRTPGRPERRRAARVASWSPASSTGVRLQLAARPSTLERVSFSSWRACDSPRPSPPGENRALDPRDSAGNQHPPGCL